MAQSILEALGGSFYDGFGGINLSNIFAALERAGVNDYAEQTRQAQKIIKYLTEIKKRSGDKFKDGDQRPRND